MGVPIASQFEKSDSPTLRDVGYIPQISRLESWGAASHDAYLFNPEPAASRLVELYDANTDLDKISEEEFNKSFEGLGIEWDEVYSFRGAEIVASRKRNEIRRRQIIAANSEGIINQLALFGASLIGSMLSPTNIAVSFIPIGGQARWAAIAMKHGRLMKSLAKGAVSGFVGAALVEPIGLAASIDEQADYTAMDSLYSLTISAVFGAGLHFGGEQLGNLFSSRARRQAKGQLMATQIATEQLVEGKRVDVSAIKAATDSETILHTRSVADAETGKRSVTSTLDPEDVKAGKAGIKTIKTAPGSVEVKFKEEKGRLAGLIGEGIDEKTAKANLISEYERLRTAIETNPNASRMEELQRRLESLVLEREAVQAVMDSRTKLPKELKALSKQAVPLEATLKSFDAEIAARKNKVKALNGDPDKASTASLEIAEIENSIRFLEKSKQSFKEITEKMNLSSTGKIDSGRLSDIKRNIKEVSKELDIEAIKLAQSSLRASAKPEASLFHQEKPEGFRDEPDAFNELKDDLASSELEEAQNVFDRLFGEEGEAALTKAERNLLDEASEPLEKLATRDKAMAIGVNCLIEAL